MSGRGITHEQDGGLDLNPIPSTPISSTPGPELDPKSAQNLTALNLPCGYRANIVDL